MDKKIGEMTLEELQDYALQLEQANTQANEKIAQIEGEKTNLVELNQALQKRNNDLFMRVESQIKPDKPEDKKEPEKVESCEDFAKNLILGRKE